MIALPLHQAAPSVAAENSGVYVSGSSVDSNCGLQKNPENVRESVDVSDKISEDSKKKSQDAGLDEQSSSASTDIVLAGGGSDDRKNAVCCQVLQRSGQSAEVKFQCCGNCDFYFVRMDDGKEYCSQWIDHGERELFF